MADEKKTHEQHSPHHGGKDSGAHAQKQGGAPAPHQSQPQGQPQQKGRPEQKVGAPKKDYGENFRGIVRIAGKDVKGEMTVRRAVVRVKGVGERLGAILSDIAMEQMKLANDTVVGLLTEDQVAKLEDMLSHPRKYGVPPYMLNRQKDPDTGEAVQLIGNDVSFYMNQDIEHDKNMNSWRGYRHLYGQKVRGQHNRTTGRTGMTVGVLRKTVLAAKAAAVAQESARPGAPGAAGAPVGAGAKAAVPGEKGREAAVAKAPAAGAAPKAAEKKEQPKK